MLVLTRKVGQKLVIGDDITIVVNRISGNRVSLGIEAPAEVPIIREELQQIREEFAAHADDQEAVTLPPALLTDVKNPSTLAASPR